MKTDRLNYYRRLARQGNKSAQRVCDAFNPDQPREADGKWGSGGGKGSAAYHNEKATEHATEAAKYISNEHHTAHMNAAAAHAVAAAGAHVMENSKDPYLVQSSRSQQEAVQKAETLSAKANAM